jgi:hypothetical protein
VSWPVVSADSLGEHNREVDNDPKLGRIVHIAMRGLKIKNPRSPDRVSDRVDHLPFAGWFR